MALDILTPYFSEARNLIKEGAIKTVLFSGPTYQVEVHEKSTLDATWVFMQFSPEGIINDIFSNNEESFQKTARLHMAAAYLFVMAQDGVPLHSRFMCSFYNRLFKGLNEKLGPILPRVIQEQKEDFEKITIQSEEGMFLFSVTVESSKIDQLSPILLEREEENEENSIKFSNLDEKQIENWYRGSPPPELRYELSLFSDFAKWLYLKQHRNEPYTIIFSPTDKIPEKVVCSFSGYTIEVLLDQGLLEGIIPALTTIDASLRNFLPYAFGIQSLEYIAKKKHIEIQVDQDKAKEIFKNTKEIGPWSYIPEQGFLLEESIDKHYIIEQKDLSDFLCNHAALVEKFSGYSVDLIAKPLQYDLLLDTDGVLHIDAYLFSPKEFQKKEALFLGFWAFLPEKGFVRIAVSPFHEVHKKVTREELSDFIQQHGHWLGRFSGFQVHPSLYEQEITYHIDLDGHLHFKASQKQETEENGWIDCNEWIYVPQSGFYPKQDTTSFTLFSMQGPIPRHTVSDFIRLHIKELEEITGFFTDVSPIKEIGLTIELKKRGVIEISPNYIWHDVALSEKALFYDEFVYIEDTGFYVLSSYLRPLHFAREIHADDPAAWETFFLETLPNLEQEYTCMVDKRLKRGASLSLFVNPKDDINQDANEWQAELFWKSDLGKISVENLVQAYKRKERFVPTDAGVIDLREDRFHWLTALIPAKGTKDSKKAELKFSAKDLLRIQAYEPVNFENKGKTSDSKNFLEKLVSLEPHEPPEYEGFTCTLRSYQQKGLEWLWFLYLHGLSGLLCDDMGVGKTHQAIALMASISCYKKKKNEQTKVLVICPTSLIYHWREKLEKNLPSFRVKIYVASDRDLEDFPEEYDLFLTTYGIWRNEVKMLKRYNFDVAFFDELQIAKNHVSQIHKALLQAQAKIKVGLTGTPIENQLRELKSIFDIVMPGYMPNDSDYREFFVRPIEKAENRERRQLLSRFVKPFVLRRKKVDVLPELPEKTEELCYSELLGEQKTLYKTVAAHRAQPLIDQLRDDASPIPYMHIFALLLSLKQICNHPACYLKDVENYERYESGKWEIFIELLEEAKESGQKVVVFSQYLGMLDIIAKHLDKQGTIWTEIRGQTKNRGAAIERFHNDPECLVFLGSLQAAGLGIDLTPASVVIHYDRWWNAARENQATDRVHRIGQVRGVQVLKLVTKFTIEESIDKMIARKSDFLEDIVACDDHQVVKKLSRGEIISLLEGLSLINE